MNFLTTDRMGSEPYGGWIVFSSPHPVSGPLVYSLTLQKPRLLAQAVSKALPRCLPSQGMNEKFQPIQWDSCTWEFDHKDARQLKLITPSWWSPRPLSRSFYSLHIWDSWVTFLGLSNLFLLLPTNLFLLFGWLKIRCGGLQAKYLDVFIKFKLPGLASYPQAKLVAMFIASQPKGVCYKWANIAQGICLHGLFHNYTLHTCLHVPATHTMARPISLHYCLPLLPLMAPLCLP